MFLYFGLCQGSVVSLPQIRNDRVAKKQKTVQDKERLQELRNIAVSKLVSAEKIRSVWKALEPHVLNDYVKYGKHIKKQSKLEQGPRLLANFTKVRSHYFDMFSSDFAVTQVKKEIPVQNKHQCSLSDLRSKAYAYQRGQVLEIEDDSDDNDGW